MNETTAMRRALALAVRGWGRVSPNPVVGAVLLKDGRVIGQGYHAEFGGAHAEVEALRGAGDSAGATMVVTLEPCNHHGKTPPCTDALLAARIGRVVYAMPDPGRESGGGGDRLRAHGVSVEAGLLQREAAALMAPFLWAQRRPDRPFVALKLATSLDGFIAPHPGRAGWISGPEARDYVHWLRAGFDAIGVGRRPAEIDDPQLTARGRVTPRVPPARVVFGRSTAPLPSHLEVVRTAAEIRTVMAVVGKPAASTASPPPGVEVLAAGSLPTTLSALRGMGLTSILIEGGGRFAAALLAANLVDRFYWIQSPVVLGAGVPAFPLSGRPGCGPADPASWTVVQRRELGRDTLLVTDRELCLPAS